MSSAPWGSGLVERLLRRKTLRMVAREAQVDDREAEGADSSALLPAADAVVLTEDGESVPEALGGEQGSDVGADGEGGGDSKKAHGLRRELKLMDIVAYGVGCTVGAGIYSLVGEGARVAGPGVLFSFMVGAFSCVLTGLAYSELAALIPLSGSAYTYALVTLGELPAWLVGWNLTLEYAISAAAIARSWGSYVGVIFKSAGAPLPVWMSALPLAEGWTLSPLAALLVVACTAMLTRGVSASSRFNLVVTAVNMLVLTFVVGYGAFFVDPANWTAVNDSFVPYGASSIMQGAGVVFFSFLGFDMVSSLAEEVQSPQTTMPLGIIASLAASAGVYVAVCLVVTGMAPFPEFTSAEHIDAPLSFVFQFHGAAWAAVLVAVGSVAGLTSAAFTCIMGQPRIFYRMARDGLLWKFFADVSPTTGVPILGTWLTGLLTALVALFVPLDVLAQAISIGTLLAFCAVCAGVMVLHLDAPDCASSSHGGPGWLTVTLFSLLGLNLLWLCLLPRRAIADAPFLCPAMPLVPGAGMAINCVMMASLPFDSWLRMLGWAAVGLAVYVFYGVWHSILRDPEMAALLVAPAAAADSAKPSRGSASANSGARRNRPGGYEGLVDDDADDDDQGLVIGDPASAEAAGESASLVAGGRG
ncbi:hypothetical protein FNF27_03043 [Cafeteria roenbergensis]|uniref:Cationic amino acid transporter C-terminal domain-containing protein n=1 Tax=Cafeteria roenbergensis TaxID=33653 RepID=A0A5A8EHE9_CAFRO|nr:hypothetical protein FNF28_06810 [Cafeteria roenbergensis]KAA0175340.1 hypothetical protein FNF27_03043 [Cafeteria roenbergensis]